MTTLPSEDCQTNDLNDLFPMSIESLRFPLDNSMRIVFTGYYNGFNIEVRSSEEAALLYHMGCFGKGSASRSRPVLARNDCSPQIMRRRQFFMRNYWHKKFGSPEDTTKSDVFLKDLDRLTAKIVSDGDKQVHKDVIDLVSSDEDNDDEDMDEIDHSRNKEIFRTHDKEDIVVIVPNSDSEDENYFANLRTKCCVNKIKMHEKLILTLEEAFFLIYGLGCLQVVNRDNNLLNIEQCWELFTITDRNFITKYIVYHYFRSKGYVVKPGIKFGGDYLLYRDGPSISHADYIVVIKNGNKEDWISTLGHVRVASTTVKEVLIVEIIEPTEQSVMLPEGLGSYSVREILLTRNIPAIINSDD